MGALLALTGGAVADPADPDAGASADVSTPKQEIFGRAVSHLAKHALVSPLARGRLGPGGVRLRGDGFRVVVVDNTPELPEVHVYAVYSGGAVRERGYLLGHLTPVVGLSYSPDESILATVGGSDASDGERSIRLWNAEALNRKTPEILLGDGVPTAVAWSPNGKYAAVGDATGAIYLVRNRHGGQRARRLGSHASSIGGLLFSSDSRTLFSVSAPGDDGGWRAWSVADRKRLPAPAFPSLEAPVTTLERGHGAGLALVGEADGRLLAFEIASGETRWETRLGGAVRRVRPGWDGNSLLVAAEGHATPYVLGAEDGAPWPVRFTPVHASGLVDCTVDTETGLLVLAHRDGVVEYWRVAGAPRPRLFK